MLVNINLIHNTCSDQLYLLFRITHIENKDKKINSYKTRNLYINITSLTSNISRAKRKQDYKYKVI